ncbi:hypothetical protein BJ742DRAFT_683376 [Cladochytrium replicatum]|nr:hypothetical protein BJ742DRAFT_683376 [Cladochytrium replicatum]
MQLFYLPANDPVEPSRLDLRVARVLEVSKHPDADSLYVEQMDVGEDKPRTVVSGLVKHMKESDLKDKLVVLVCNLKPAKMRGIESQAMVLCATDPDTGKVELIEPAGSSKPGERVYFGEYRGTPDGVLNPKKKVWETVQPQFITDAKCRATYVDAESKAVSVMVTASGGECKATSVVGGGIK